MAIASVPQAMMAQAVSASAPAIWLKPRIAVGQTASQANAWLPQGAQWMGAAVQLQGTGNPSARLLKHASGQYALLIGSVTGSGQYEAWHWATFMNCAACRDDKTTKHEVKLSERGNVLLVESSAYSESERAHWKALWRVRQDAQDPTQFRIIGLDVTSGIEGRQAASESSNFLTGQMLRRTGSMKDGRLQGPFTEEKLQAEKAPTLDQAQPVF